MNVATVRLLQWILVVMAVVCCGSQHMIAAEPPEHFRVGSKKFTESVILAHMMRQLLEVTEIEGARPTTELFELAGTRILWSSLLAGEIDMYVDYTGTISHEILSGEPVASLEEMRDALKLRGVTMLHPLGFNNTYAIGMLESTAQSKQIKSISDLKNYSELKFGFSSEFMDREDGWPGLRTAYQLQQTDVTGLDHDLAYRGLESGNIEVMDLYSTDAEIEYYKLRTLKDDQQYFPNYQAVVLVRNEVAEIPGVVDVLRQIDGAIGESEMVAMNAQAKINRVPTAKVASQFIGRKLGIQTEARVDSRYQQLLGYTISHLQLVIMSLVPAILVAILLGVAAAKIPWLQQGVLSIVGIIQTIPALALLVVMIPLLGIGFAPAVFALFLYSLLPIVRATHQGITGIPKSLSESALAIGLPPFERFRRIELPMAMPVIVSGIKVAAVINVGFATLGALIGAGGYGQPILTGIRLDDMQLILLGAIPSAVMALVVQWLFEYSERWIVPRGLRLKGS